MKWEIYIKKLRFDLMYYINNSGIIKLIETQKKPKVILYAPAFVLNNCK